MDAAAAEYGTDEGAGWLFSVNRISADAFHEAVCYDMSGEEVFARDGDGNYYMYCHPTDVRFVRESYEDIDEDMAQWTMLNQWAAAVPDNFLLENPGLTPEKHGNTDLDMYLARAAYLDGVKYIISAPEWCCIIKLDTNSSRIDNGEKGRECREWQGRRHMTRSTRCRQ